MNGLQVGRARERLELSQDDFAAMLGISQSTVSRWEKKPDSNIPKRFATRVKAMLKRYARGETLTLPGSMPKEVIEYRPVDPSRHDLPRLYLAPTEPPRAKRKADEPPPEPGATPTPAAPASEPAPETSTTSARARRMRRRRFQRRLRFAIRKLSRHAGHLILLLTVGCMMKHDSPALTAEAPRAYVVPSTGHLPDAPAPQTSIPEPDCASERERIATLTETNRNLSRALEGLVTGQLAPDEWAALIALPNGSALGSALEAPKAPSHFAVPETPFKWQKKAPCDPDAYETVMNGGCWVEVGTAPCRSKAFEKAGKCFRPVAQDSPLPPSSLKRELR